MTRKDADAHAATNSQDQIQARLIDRYGPVMGGRDLQQVLGFPSSAAFRQAALRGTLPVAVFSVPFRRGRFALTHEVAEWLFERRSTAAPSIAPERHVKTQGGGLS